MKKTTLVAIVALTLILSGLSYFAYLTSVTPAPLVVVKNATYICKGNKIIGAKFYLQSAEQPKVTITNEPPVPTGSVDITLSDGRSLHLAQTISGSGVRYSNTDESFIFWTKGNDVIVLEDNEGKNFIDCEVRARPLTSNSTSTKKFLYDAEDFSIILPRFTTPPELTRTDSYTVDTSHSYGLIPGESITGVKFTIPSTVTQGTNLSKDTYFSVEKIPKATKCSADMFFEEKVTPILSTENKITYSTASTTGAGAGNRYEETVYAIQGKNMCLAVRYYIHYSVFENYPKGSIKEFNHSLLIDSFDTIRKTLTVKK